MNNGAKLSLGSFVPMAGKAGLPQNAFHTLQKKSEKFTVPFAFKNNDASPNRKENSVEGRHLWCFPPSKCADKHVV